MKTVLISSDFTPFWEAKINGKTYRYPSGTVQNVPDEVASLIENINALTPVPGLPGKPGQVWMLGEDGMGRWTDLPAAVNPGAANTVFITGADGKLKWGSVDPGMITAGNAGQFLKTGKRDGVPTAEWNSSKASLTAYGAVKMANPVDDAADDGSDLIEKFNALLNELRRTNTLSGTYVPPAPPEPENGGDGGTGE